MKKIILLFLLVFSVFFSAQNLTEFRLLMQKGENSETSAKLLYDKSKKEFEKTQKPIFEALYAVGNFFMAKHVGNPMSKYSYFNRGKKHLESAIKRDPDNVEMRFMRYISQDKTPSILGYKDQMESDKKFVLKEFKNIKDEDLQLFIKKYFKL